MRFFLGTPAAVPRSAPRLICMASARVARRPAHRLFYRACGGATRPGQSACHGRRGPRRDLRPGRRRGAADHLRTLNNGRSTTALRPTRPAGGQCNSTRRPRRCCLETGSASRRCAASGLTGRYVTARAEGRPGTPHPFRPERVGELASSTHFVAGRRELWPRQASHVSTRRWSGRQATLCTQNDIGCSTTSSKSFWSPTISAPMPRRVSHHRSGSKFE